jgi:hypothetical protein
MRRIEFGVADAPGIEFGVSPWSIYHGDTKGIKAQLLAARQCKK